MKKRGISNIKLLREALYNSLNYLADMFYSPFEGYEVPKEDDEPSVTIDNTVANDMARYIIGQINHIDKKLLLIDESHQVKIDKAEALFYKKLNKITKDLQKSLDNVETKEIRDALIIASMNLVREESNHWAEICAKSSLVRANKALKILDRAMYNVEAHIYSLESQKPDEN